MPAELVLVRCQDGSFRPATSHDQELASKWKIGQPVRVQATQLKPRSLQHHKLFFGGLMALAYDYYEPPGGLITPAEKQALSQFAAWLDRHAGNSGAILNAQEAYTAEIERKRADKLQAPEKSMDALLEWVKLEVGHYELINTPRGIAKRTRSINFNSLDGDEFSDFYKRAFSVIWRFILHRSFDTEEQAQNAVDQLLSLG